MKRSIPLVVSLLVLAVANLAWADESRKANY